MSLAKLREKLEESQKKVCIVIFANGRSPDVIVECCRQLREHIHFTHVDYYCIVEVGLYNHLTSLGKEENGNLVIEGIPLQRLITQCPTAFATRGVYWTLLTLINKFKEYTYGMLLNAKIGLNFDLSDDSLNKMYVIQNANNFTKPPIAQSVIAKDFDLTKSYHSAFWAGNIVEHCETIERMIEQDVVNDVLVFNADYYFSKYIQSYSGPMEIELLKEDEDFLNKIKININKNKTQLEAINEKLKEYDAANPDKEVKDRNPNSPEYHTFPEEHMTCYDYPDDMKLYMIADEKDCIVTVLSKAAKCVVKFDLPPEQDAEPVAEPVVEPVQQPVEQEPEPVEQVAEPVQQPIEQSVQEEEKVTEPAEQPVEQVAEPVQQVVEPIEQPIEQVVEQSEQPAPKRPRVRSSLKRQLKAKSVQEIPDTTSKKVSNTSSKSRAATQKVEQKFDQVAEPVKQPEQHVESVVEQVPEPVKQGAEQVAEPVKQPEQPEQPEQPVEQVAEQAQPTSRRRKVIRR